MGVISTKAHTVIGLLVGVLLIFAPGLLGMTDGVAAAIPLWVGIFIILSELITTSPFSPVKLVPMKVHIALDVITGAFLAVSPWLFSFADSGTINWVPHLLVGIVVIGYALLTNTADDRPQSSVVS